MVGLGETSHGGANRKRNPPRPLRQIMSTPLQNTYLLQLFKTGIILFVFLQSLYLD